MSTSDEMDAVFQALANPARRQMLDLVRHEPGVTVGKVCDGFEMSRIGAMKHLQILEEAGLITSRTEGRRRLLYVNAIPIQMIYDRWISDWSSLWANELTALKYRVEQAEEKGKDTRSGAISEDPRTQDPRTQDPRTQHEVVIDG